jgi:hypothetical protein
VDWWLTDSVSACMQNEADIVVEDVEDDIEDEDEDVSMRYFLKWFIGFIFILTASALAARVYSYHSKWCNTHRTNHQLQRDVFR